MRALFCGALALALGAAAAPARGDDSKSARVWLDWSHERGTEGCLPPEDIAREVEELLGRRIFASRSESDRTLHVDVTHEVDPARYIAQMILRSKAGKALGTREIVIETSVCQDASDAFVLAISMLADVPRTPEETTGGPPPPVRTGRPPWHMRAAVGPALSIDTNGAVSPGGHGAATLSPPSRWPFGLAVLSTVQSSALPGARRSTLSSTALAVIACLPSHQVQKLELMGCIGPQMTVHVGSGSGFPTSRTGAKATYGGMLQAYGVYAIGPAVHPFAMVALAATPQQVDVVFTDPSGAPHDVHLTSNVSFAASIGIAVDIF